MPPTFICTRLTAASNWLRHLSQSACFYHASLCRPSAIWSKRLRSRRWSASRRKRSSVFSRFAEQQAHDLLRPHGPIIMALSVVLKIRRTLTGAEIDDVIATTVAGLGLAAERRRRAEWRKASWRPSAFVTHAITPMPQPCHGLHQIACGNRQHQNQTTRRM